MRRAIQFPVRSVLVATMLLLGLAACGDDDDEAATDSTTTTAASGGDTAAYCEKSLAIETASPAPDVDFESLSPEQQKEEIKKFVNSDIKPLVAEIEPVIPEEIAAEGAVLIAGIDKVAETGDFQAFESDPKIQEAEAKVHTYDLDNCGWGKSDVAGVDFAFQGLPDKLEAGPHSFDFSNKGKEFHMIALLRAKDDVKESFDEILELPQEQGLAKADFIGEATAPPGDGDYFVADLKPGRYVAVCFINTGTTSPDKQGEGPPHFVQGMKSEFEVS